MRTSSSPCSGSAGSAVGPRPTPIPVTGSPMRWTGPKRSISKGDRDYEILQPEHRRTAAPVTIADFDRRQSRFSAERTYPPFVVRHGRFGKVRVCNPAQLVIVPIVFQRHLVA